MCELLDSKNQIFVSFESLLGCESIQLTGFRFERINILQMQFDSITNDSIQIF